MVTKDLFQQAKKFYSQDIANHEPYFTLTSCMNPEEREIIGYCYAYIELFGSKDPFSKLLLKKYIPALAKIGIARWNRSEFSDLGFRLAYKGVKDVRLGSKEEKGMSLSEVFKELEKVNALNTSE